MQARLSARAIAAIAALAVFSVWITWKAKSLEAGLDSIESSVKLQGQPAPDFTLTSLDGEKVSLADFRGKKTVVVSFWASWCGPCRMELPVLREFYKKTHTPDSNFEVVAISLDDDRQAAEAYAEQAKLPFPVLLDVVGKVGTLYQADTIPRLYVIGPDGKVKAGHVGFDQTFTFQLAQDLGIKNYSPIAGAPGGSAGH